MTGLRATNKERNRRQILLAAATIVEERGLAAMTMREIARCAQLSVPTIYNLIGGTNDVVLAIVTSQNDRYGAQFENSTANPEDRAVAAVTGLADTMLEHRTVTREIIGHSQTMLRAAGGPGIFSKATEVLTGCFRQAENEGLIRAHLDPAILARRTMGMIIASAHSWANNDSSDAALRVEAEHAVLLIIAAVSMPAGRDRIDARLREVELRLTNLTGAPDQTVRTSNASP